MHLSRPHARVGLLAAAAALIALFVAAPTAGAAQFAEGPVKLDFKNLKLKVLTKGADPNTKTGGTFEFSESGAGTATMTNQASGNLTIGGSQTSITLTHANKKKIVLMSLVEKLTAGKAQLTAKIGGKGKAIAFFDQASTNNLKPSSDFKTLDMSTSSMTVTKAGAAALNKAFGLKAPARGKRDLRIKAKAKAGSASFSAQRSVAISGGTSKVVYDQAFVQALRDCDITLNAVAPATAIPKDASAPEGGAELPVVGGILNAVTLVGTINNSGGTVLDRPAGGPKGKPAYNSPLTNFTFAFREPGSVPRNLLSATVVNLNTVSPVGEVTGTPVTDLVDTGGSVTLTGELLLSTAAATLLSGKEPPLGADCNIPAGSKIGAVTMNATGS